MGYALRWKLIQWSAHGMSISYFSLLPLYVKSPPHRMTSHHVYTCIIVLGHIPVGHSYWKTNLSPYSKPSLQCPAFPSVAVSSNSQSSVHHFLITNLPLPNINIVRLYHYNKNLPIKQLQLFRQVSTLAEAVGFEPTSPWGLPDFESGPLWPLRYASLYVNSGSPESDAYSVLLESPLKQGAAVDQP